LGPRGGVGRERISWTAREVLFPRRPELEESYANAGWTRIPPLTPSIFFYLRGAVAFYESYYCELYTRWTGYVTAFWLVGWKS
jgi:hypothetical protein